jgi:hypothetical protein
MPQEVNDALREVSRRQFTTIAEYIRRALLAQLEHDGICPNALTIEAFGQDRRA